jgi:uncharacterized membrane-anchored protein
MLRSSRTRRLLGAAALAAAVAIVSPASAQQPRSQEQVTEQISALGWQRGPADAQIGAVASLKVGDGFAFLDASNTRRFLELTGNPPRDNHYTLVAAGSSWFAVFVFEDSGYVKDDEKLDADALLKSMQEADKPGNEERKRLGMPPLHTVGWHVPPHYDPATKRLEWGLRLQGDTGPPVVNYTIRLLGRRGVMHATLVADPGTLDRDIAQFKGALSAYHFAPGEKYSEFRAGDRIAEYGLAGLVLGGAAVIATKTGFLKAMGKFLILGAVALSGAAAALFRKLFRRS